MTEPEYLRAETVEAAVGAMCAAGGDGMIVAGGIVVGSLFNQHLAHPSVLVDISRIAALRRIELGPAGELLIGALATHEDVRTSPLVGRAAPLLSKIAGHISCARLRNRGTIGGSLCTIGGQGDPATGLIALGAELEIQGRNGRRTIPIESFYASAFAVDLELGEVLARVVVPPADEGARGGFCKLGPRNAMDWTQITASVALCERGGRIEEVRIGLNGVGPTPSRPHETEAALSGHDAGSSVAWAELHEVLSGEINPEGDLVYSEEFKRTLAGVALRRAYDSARASRNTTHAG